MNYPSRLLQRLDQRLRECNDPREIAHLRCRRAIHLARLNQLAGARSEIEEVRALLGPALDPTSGVWVLLAEGVVAYFSFELEKSFDRLRRSQGIARAANLTSALAGSSAWLSHVQYQRSDYAAAIACLLEAISSASVEDHFARCRIALTAGNITGLANLPTDSRQWQQRARIHANADGDESSLAALIFNSNIYRVNEFRLASAFSLPLPDDVGQVQLELDSSLNFDALASSAGLPGNPNMLKGYLASALRKHDIAVQCLTDAMNAGSFSTDRASIEAELAYSLAMIGRESEAVEHINLAKSALETTVDDDDKAFVNARLASICGVMQDSSGQTKHASLASAALASYRQLQESLRTELSRLPAPDSV